MVFVRVTPQSAETKWVKERTAREMRYNDPDEMQFDSRKSMRM